METYLNINIPNMIQNTLNYVDTRLMDHGKRVAYCLFRILKCHHAYSRTELRDICILAMLHDIGAYKTEEIDKMLQFETNDVWDHSIYGYLFLQQFSPLKELAPVVLYHHADCDEIKELPFFHQELAQLISLCDRADIFLQCEKDMKGFYAYVEKNRSKKFKSEIVDRFLAADIPFESIDTAVEMDAEFHAVLYDTPFTIEEINHYISMIIFSIDFRSGQTVIHTITVAYITGIIARLAGIPEDEISKMTMAAMLHDIGKVGTPVSILESESRLSASEMNIMKEHVVITEKILSGNVLQDVIRIAVNHHEKLNGTGYPKGLRDTEIAYYDRIVAIADILSALYYARSYKEAYPKEKITGILQDMRVNGLLDSEIVQLVMEQYDVIIDETNRLSKPVLEEYHRLREEYQELKNKHIHSGKE